MAWRGATAVGALQASKAKRRPLFLLMKEAGTELMGAWNWPFFFERTAQDIMRVSIDIVEKNTRLQSWETI